MTGSKSSRRDFVKMAATGAAGVVVGAVAGNYYGSQTSKGSCGEELALAEKEHKAYLDDATKTLNQYWQDKISALEKQYQAGGISTALKGAQDVLVVLGDGMSELELFCQGCRKYKQKVRDPKIGCILNNEPYDLKRRAEAWDYLLPKGFEVMDGLIVDADKLKDELKKYLESYKAICSDNKAALEEWNKEAAVNEYGGDGTYLWGLVDAIRKSLRSHPSSCTRTQQLFAATYNAADMFGKIVEDGRQYWFKQLESANKALLKHVKGNEIDVSNIDGFDRWWVVQNTNSASFCDIRARYASAVEAFDLEQSLTEQSPVDLDKLILLDGMLPSIRANIDGVFENITDPIVKENIKTLIKDAAQKSALDIATTFRHYTEDGYRKKAAERLQTLAGMSRINSVGDACYVLNLPLSHYQLYLPTDPLLDERNCVVIDDIASLFDPLFTVEGSSTVTPLIPKESLSRGNTNEDIIQDAKDTQKLILDLKIEGKPVNCSFDQNAAAVESIRELYIRRVSTPLTDTILTGGVAKALGRPVRRMVYHYPGYPVRCISTVWFNPDGKVLGATDVEGWWPAEDVEKWKTFGYWDIAGSKAGGSFALPEDVSNK